MVALAFLCLLFASALRSGDGLAAWLAVWAIAACTAWLAFKTLPGRRRRL